jgi:malonyl-CoA O-methyltransferase
MTSIYWRAMSDPTPTPAGFAHKPRMLDAIAVAAALRRMAAAPQPPWLHAEVARRMAQRLLIVKLQPETVLEWWGHTGASGGLLAAAYPKARRIVVEPIDALLQRSRRAAKVPWWSARRRARAADVQSDADGTPGAAQLLWANMMLHAVADPPVLLARWQRLLATDGFVMFSCLGPGTLRELRVMYRGLGWPPPAPDFVDMHDLGDMLVQAGFADPVMDQETLTLTWDSAQALLAELRGLGGNASPARWPALRTPRWRERLCAGLQSLAGADGRLGLSFEIVYGHAFKAAPAVKGESVVTLEDMRAMMHSSGAWRR